MFQVSSVKMHFVVKKNIYSVEHARKLAKTILPKVVFDYIDGGAEDETTMLENTQAFREIYFHPKMAQGRFTPDIKIELFGQTLDLPVILAPCGLVKVMHPSGGIAAVEAARNFNTISVLSAVAGTSIEQASKVSIKNLWFQLYVSTGRQEAGNIIDRVEKTGINTLVVTIDTPALGNRLRDLYNGVSTPLKLGWDNGFKLAYQALSRPLWIYRMVNDAVKITKQSSGQFMSPEMLKMAESPFSWDDIAWIRERWRGNLVVKGVLSAKDALNAIDVGADAIVVSNHGGRQLNGVLPTIKVLPDVKKAVGDKAVIILDSGIRQSSDVIKALCLGADAVMIGRAYLYGLAVDGQYGIERILHIFKTGLIRDLTLLGVKGVSELNSEWVNKTQL